MRSRLMRAGLSGAAGMALTALAFGLPTRGAAALTPSFTVIATLSGTPVIGAYKGGTLYGTMPSGGAGYGLLFSVTTKGGYTPLHSFAYNPDGDAPNGGIDLDASGDVYGTTQYGGADGGGTLWEYSPATGMKTLHAFGGAGDGNTPLQGPTRVAGGAIYGSAAGGAVHTNGSLWRLLPNGSYKSLYNFLSTAADGHCPFSGVVRSGAGPIYGTTSGMGVGGDPLGTVWQYTSTGLKTLHVFQDGDEGEFPDQAPALDNAGTLYGTTHKQYDAEFAGAIWKVTAGGSFSVVYDLVAATDGFGPNSPLMLNADGNLYGTTASGGPGGGGTVFQVTPAGVFTVMHAFSGGAGPTGMLTHDSKGNIYGGASNGQVFKITPPV